MTTLTKETCDNCGWVDYLTQWDYEDGSEAHLCTFCVRDERRAMREGYEVPRP